MKIKKIAAALLVMTVMVGSMSVNAFAAHGYRYTTGSNTATYTICSVEDCTQTSTHDHDGTTYYAHHNADGHTYHSQEHTNGGSHNSAYGHH